MSIILAKVINDMWYFHYFTLMFTKTLDFDVKIITNI